MITRETVQETLLAYLNRQLTLAELVDWAENALQDGELDPRDTELLSEVLARLGLADVRQFGLTWEDCSNYLAQLGYQVEIRVTAA
jgi:hypothetical protein